MKVLKSVLTSPSFNRLPLLLVVAGVFALTFQETGLTSTSFLAITLGLLVVSILVNHQKPKRIIKPVEFEPHTEEKKQEAAVKVPVAQAQGSSKLTKRLPKSDSRQPLSSPKISFKPMEEQEGQPQGQSLEQHLQPSCAFMLNTNSDNPSAFLLPDLASINSFMLMPKELSQFFNANMANVMLSSDSVKQLRPVDKEYRKQIRKMSLNAVKNPVENGSIILPIHFLSDN